ncbi:MULTISPECIES: GtrA family protein [unclassified Siphonobacter]|uniref:GtrA family protein n=1 Tax=unclassified Siphonobacter TaxID=2635712 RepID=UPI0027895051|nr:MULTISPECIES: GtrA family protein [unclassified Siphonobacter]MDQ1086031.1 putative flippase GtrA [Siphonobacter sp. SORGH_AS_1065]MDR6196355.1 putative flippase GtrA [Siphonobacter sp. SORGH_AS_0500]
MKTTLAQPLEKKKSKLLNIRDLVAYFLVAGTGAAVQIIAGGYFREFMSYNASVACGYVVSFVVGFTLTKLFAFDAKKSGQTRREMVKFGLVAVVSFFITVGGSSLGFHLLNASHPGDLYYRIPLDFLSEKSRNINVKEFGGLLVGMGLSFVSNYILHKTFTFKSTGFYDRIKDYLKGIPE